MLLLMIPYGFLTFFYSFIHLFSICCFLLCVRPHVKYWGAELNKLQSCPQGAYSLSGGDHQGQEPSPGIALGSSSRTPPLLISLPSYSISQTTQNPHVQLHKHSSSGTFSNTCFWQTSRINTYGKVNLILSFFFFLHFYLFIYLFNLFLAVLALCFCARAFSSCSKWGPLFIAVCGPLTIAASLVAEHRLQTHRLSSCGSWAQLLRGMWDLPRPGLKPVSPALAGRFSTTAPPGKPSILLFICISYHP